MSFQKLASTTESIFKTIFILLHITFFKDTDYERKNDFNCSDPIMYAIAE